MARKTIHRSKTTPETRSTIATAAAANEPALGFGPVGGDDASATHDELTGDDSAALDEFLASLLAKSDAGPAADDFEDEDAGDGDEDEEDEEDEVGSLG